MYARGVTALSALETHASATSKGLVMTIIDAPRARPKAHIGVFRYSPWDAVPAAVVFTQAGLLLAFLLAFPAMGWGWRLGCGALYAFAVAWTLDAAAHNFVHNPWFASARANRATGFVLSVLLGTPLTGYRYLHMRHHAGSCDPIGEDGRTLDPISLYQYGRGGQVEPALSYILKQYWRDESPLKVIRLLRAKRPTEAREAVQELVVMAGFVDLALVLDWQAALFLLPFFYLGQCFGYAIAYYEHLGADPRGPIPTGVSTYGRAYNWVFLNNGYHAEHHYRPKAHWSRMAEVTHETAAAMGEAGIRTLRQPHFLGFLERQAAPTRLPPAPSRPTFN